MKIKQSILIIFILILVAPNILAGESCEEDICFNKTEQNCLFFKLIPYNIIIGLSYLALYLKFNKQIKSNPIKKKIKIGISAFLIYVILGFTLGKLYIFNTCSI
jgi:hypothetical protein